MNGPEHYREAERLLDMGNTQTAEAQVHATLAMAAAVVEASHNPERMQYPWLTAIGLVTE